MLLCLSFISVDETWISIPSNMYGLGSYTEATGYRNKTWSSQTVSFAIVSQISKGTTYIALIWDGAVGSIDIKE